MKKLKLLLNFTLLILITCNINANELTHIRAWSSPEKTRLVLDLNSSPDYSYFNLSNPSRLVIDIKKTKLVENLTNLNLNATKLIKKIRTSTPKSKQDLRLVIELNKKLKSKIFILNPVENYKYRLVVDLIDNQAVKKVQQQEKKRQQIVKNNNARDIFIAIDAGHGGDDPGAIGPTKIYEKNVTLAISKKLQKIFNAEKGISAMLVRKGDYFVDLNKRSEIARKNKADLLISIHADGFTSSKPHGASVWVISDRRTGREINNIQKDHDKHSELLGGVGDAIKKNNSNVSTNLITMLLGNTSDYSRIEGKKIANNILKYIKKITSLHKKKPAEASLAVVKAPDIPSLLVEAGFITNHREEKLLNSKQHQQNIAKAIYKGVVEYFKSNPPERTWYFKKYAKTFTHVVKKGESLSTISYRYGISIQKIKRTNNLKSNILKIGQQLLIPKK